MSSRGRILAVLFFTVLLLGLHFDFKRDFDPEQIREFAEQMSAPVVWLQKTAPDFDEPTADGKRFHLADEVGQRVVILKFFATWCGPCRQEMPELRRFRGSEAGRDVLFVWIDAAEQRPEVEKFVQEFAIDFPVIIDHPGGVRKKYGVNSYPTTVVIGADGRIALYENSMIANADVSLVPPVRTAKEQLKAGRGIQRDAYLTAAASETFRGPSTSRARSRSSDLTGRPREIATKMSCLCGCTNKLLDCECKTATGMKKRLKDGPLDGKSDEEVMLALGKEFCMGGM